MKVFLYTLTFMFANMLNLLAQSNNSLPIKEEFDIYNANNVAGYQLCTLNPNSDEEYYGGGMSYILEGYISMYKATGDKAYLYKFVIQSLCVMENRHDYAGINTEPRWSENMYQDGNICAAMSRFIYFVKNEEPTLMSQSIYPFDEINPTSYQANTCNCNKFNTTFTTLGQYANWLQDHVGETLWWFLTNGYWRDAVGFVKYPYDEIAVDLNMQVGFGRALLFNGLSANNSIFLQKAMILANLLTSNVTFYDFCEDVSYDEPVFQLTSSNAYWWYHRGWRIETRTCYLFIDRPSITQYTEFIEDISHGATVTWLVQDYYHYLPNTPFAIEDMVRFRNMFLLNITDSNGDFYNSVRGSDGPISNEDDCAPNNCPHNFLRKAALNYIPLAEFDSESPTITPKVYDIVLEYYSNHISGYTYAPYNGMHNKGHAEIVLAQWTKECPNLTLYNRDVVYNQDFFSKGVLTVAPEEATGNSYAEPIISNKKFIVKPDVTVNMSAASKITLKQGTHIMAGARFRAYIVPDLCCSQINTLQNTKIYTLNKNEKEYKDSGKIENTLAINDIDIQIVAYPNPTKGQLIIELVNFDEVNDGMILISDMQGRVIFSQKKIDKKTVIDLSKQPAGNYLLRLNANKIQKEWTIIKQ